MINSKLLNLAELVITLLYSAAIVVSATPVFANISNVPVVIYYLFVPGYAVTGLINEDYNLLFRFGYSILFGISFVLAIFSMRQIYLGLALPFNVIIPTLTIALSIFHYLRPHLGIQIRMESK